MVHVIDDIKNGHVSLGVEFGSTRIKAVLIDSKQTPIASGSYNWENQLINGIWTYSLEDIWTGLQAAYRNLKLDVAKKYQVPLQKIGQIGFSAMMHGYMAFDKQGHLLVPFRTWRNTITCQAAKELSELFDFNIPERWSIAHLYQAILNKEEHVSNIAYLTTLAGYIHWQLTGEKVLGVGDASGMFPIDSETGDYNQEFLDLFAKKIEDYDLAWNLKDLLPKVLTAGTVAGVLTEDGAKRLDPSGELEAGSKLCPPEGDAGTGMVATNSVAKRTGNVSAGTSIFAMIVLEKTLKKLHPEIDIVTTPIGDAVAMVHANNCSSDINAWVKLFQEFAGLCGKPISTTYIYPLLFNAALSGDKDCGGVLSYGYYSGESITNINEGRPALVRTPDSHFNVSNLMRSHILSAFSTLAIGMEILVDEENIQIDKILGHGGIFKTPKVGQKLLATAINSPVSVMETAGEGGAWGIALLADYMTHTEQNLADYLDNVVFADTDVKTVEPDIADVAGFKVYLEKYKKGLAIERAAVETI
ncbi:MULTISPECIES: xylulokinase [Streptococcus]|uniref:xylulokinase n=1 Tax=Streptococcus TaxID=1301 RepID=UPI0022839BF9|nr:MULTISPECIES: FGGY-family carbohydrate kinase [Streptococcus]MCY7185880.1 FGGY-family carbohydrate kinase [Streptococcus gallolyticus subsp. gallolyticus]MCY7188529.1 FGGY-family carbohydrate kinase [Streptococcus gallolyticus subsp. gallolyticus]